jgi:hypothetical protein
MKIQILIILLFIGNALTQSDQSNESVNNRQAIKHQSRTIPTMARSFMYRHIAVDKITNSKEKNLLIKLKVILKDMKHKINKKLQNMRDAIQASYHSKGLYNTFQRGRFG